MYKKDNNGKVTFSCQLITEWEGYTKILDKKYWADGTYEKIIKKKMCNTEAEVLLQIKKLYEEFKEEPYNKGELSISIINK